MPQFEKEIVYYDKECEERADSLQESYVAKKKKRYYRYLGVDGRIHEIEEGKRVDVLPIGHAAC